MKKYRVMLSPDQRLFLGVILVLVLLLSYYNWRMALLGFIVLGSLYYYSWETARRRRVTLEEYLRSLAMQVETTAHDIIYNLPWGLAVLDSQGIIRWCNSRLVDMFPGLEIIGERITGLFPEIKMDREQMRLKQEERWFDLYLHRVHTRKGRGNNHVLFVQEITRVEKLLARQDQEAPCVGLIQVDNYEEVLQTVAPEERPLLAAAVDRVMADWAAEKKGFLQKYNPDRYLVLFNREQLTASREERFPVLDRVKEIKMGNKLPVTLSCGFGDGSSNLQELGSFARAGLDLALGRGGDQVVIRDPERFHFFGGKTKAMEKRTQVKARVIAHALQELMEQAAQVLVMGHRVADLDSIGAAAGMVRAARTLGKQVFIVLEDINPAVEKMVAYLAEQEDFRGVFINEVEALRVVTGGTLLVVLDTHKPSLVAVPALLERTNKVVVIDHHRRGEEFIAEPILVYLETYASSASELVTELLQYLGDNVELTPGEATALLAGIAVDTKNFSYQAGVRTFEAAAFLRRSGADQETIQRLLQDDWVTFINRAEIIKRAEVFYGKVALALVSQQGERAQLLAAQAADELLSIEDFAASFVIYPTVGGTAISARSTGDINVQVMMEQLGGGGHMTIAGAQLEGVTLSQARERVLEVIHEYFAEEAGK
ncbi:MAG: DHH family phosphoesterase [bacterium]|jgi:c-di-AMP phosphodiesterase-like protein